mmetsp:Transcript_10386/g.27903  ORF Transcript_10386/g.27903 Transcript_10386/m.27903 type:complete len:275 (+) Transcript_10386:1277-2101(+)
MSNIAKHHREQEWKRDYRKHGGIHLAVPGNAVGIDNFLEARRHVVRVEVRGWPAQSLNGVVAVVHRLHDRAQHGPRRVREAARSLLHARQAFRGTPSLRLKEVALKCAHVEHVVRRLFSMHRFRPLGRANRKAGERLAALAVARRQRHVKLPKSRCQLGVNVPLLRNVVWKRISVRAVRLAYLLNLFSCGNAREEDDEHRLEHALATRRVCDGSVDGRLLEEHVPSRRTEEHALKARDAIGGDDSGDEAKSCGGASAHVRHLDVSGVAVWRASP